MLDRNVRVCGTMSANGHSTQPRWGRHALEIEKSAFRRNGDVIVQVWNDKTCANDKYDP